LLLVSLTSLVAKFATGVIDTAGKFSLIPKVYLDLTPHLKKIEMTLKLFSGAWGKMIHEKNPKQKSCDTVLLSYT
jgi:hypothetical protein